MNEYGDDRDDIRSGDRVLLIVENDIGFARFLLDAAREKGFKGLVTSLGAAAPGTGPRVQPGRDHARHPPAGHRRLAGPGAAEEGPGARGTSRSAWSAPTRPATGRSASGCLAFLAKPIQSRDVLDGLLDHLSDYLGRPARHLLVVEPDPARREQLRKRSWPTPDSA